MDSQEYDRWAQGIAAGDWLGSRVFFQAPLYPYLLAVLYALAGAPRRPRLPVPDPARGRRLLGALPRRPRDGRRADGAGGGAARGGLRPVPVLRRAAPQGVARRHGDLLPALDAGRGADATASAAGSPPGCSSGSWRCCGRTPCCSFRSCCLSPGAARTAGRGSPAAAARWRRGSILALLPVAIRNGVVGGDFLPTSSQGGVNFYIGNHAGADGTYQPIVPGKQIPELERKEPARVAEQALGRPSRPARSPATGWQALGWARGNPGGFLRLQLRKLRMFWSWYEWPDAVDYYWVKTLSPVLRLPLLELGGAAILFAAGLLVARRRLGAFAPALLFAAGWMVSTVIFFLFSRYRLPVVPALLVRRRRRAGGDPGGLGGAPGAPEAPPGLGRARRGGLPPSPRGRLRAADGPRALQPRPARRGGRLPRRRRRALPGRPGAQSPGLPDLPSTWGTSRRAGGTGRRRSASTSRRRRSSRGRTTRRATSAGSTWRSATPRRPRATSTAPSPSTRGTCRRSRTRRSSTPGAATSRAPASSTGGRWRSIRRTRRRCGCATGFPPASPSAA